MKRYSAIAVFVDWAFRLVEHWKSKADEGNYENRRT